MECVAAGRSSLHSLGFESKKPLDERKWQARLLPVLQSPSPSTNTRYLFLQLTSAPPSRPNEHFHRTRRLAMPINFLAWVKNRSLGERSASPRPLGPESGALLWDHTDQKPTSEVSENWPRSHVRISIWRRSMATCSSELRISTFIFANCFFVS